MKKFWMVWNEGNYTPATKHNTRLLAELEAAMLARKHPDKAFHVLESILTCTHVEVHWEEHKEAI